MFEDSHGMRVVDGPGRPCAPVQQYLQAQPAPIVAGAPQPGAGVTCGVPDAPGQQLPQAQAAPTDAAVAADAASALSRSERPEQANLHVPDFSSEGYRHFVLTLTQFLPGYIPCTSMPLVATCINVYK